MLPSSLQRCWLALVGAVAMAASVCAQGAPSSSAGAASADWQAVMQRRSTWWCFQPIRPPEPASASGGADTGSPIDRLLNARLAEHGLVAAPRAAPEVLVRRLSFALRGLPPTAQEIDELVREPVGPAYEQLVDTWLASPQFGERWARHWMDWLRYADSHGSEGDPLIPYAWRYRDYLIRALNADVPYDQLLREHLAGDLLAAPRLDAATGRNESAIGPAHLRMVFHGYAPTDPLEERIRFIDDQIDVTSKAFLGLTVSCARCHDHKFDPISQQDYTALYGIFGSCAPAVITADPPAAASRPLREALDQQQQVLRTQLAEQFRAAAAKLEERLSHPDAGLQAAVQKAGDPTDLLHAFWALSQTAAASPLAAWRQRLAAVRVPAQIAWDLSQPAARRQWRHLGPGVAAVRPAGSFALAQEGDNVLLGIYPAGSYSHLQSQTDPGVMLSPRFALDQPYELWLQVAGGGGAAARYVVQDYPRDGSVFPITSLDGGQWRWLRFDLGYWTGDLAHVELATAADQPVQARIDGLRSWFGVREVLVLPRGASAPEDRCEFAAPLVAVFGESEPQGAAALAAGYSTALRTAAAAFSDGTASNEQALYLDALLRAGLLPNRLEQLPDLAVSVAECRRLEALLPLPTRVPGVIETEPRDAPLLARGNSKQPSVVVPRRSLSVFGGAAVAAAASGRLELAEDWLSTSNPLVARVIVNRVWHHLFGRGLVATPDNFGQMGVPPSHPELLDHLAGELVRQRWSLKTLIRQIVLSAAWQRTSLPPAGAAERDPDNVWLSHMPVRRLEAEAIRDSLLQVAGDLDLAMRGGPPVLGSANRRSVYVRQKRNEMDPFLGAFDAPVPASCRGQRDVTNVPAQSLTLLNDPFVLLCAEHWAQRVVGDSHVREPAARLAAMYVTAFARRPSAVEQELGLAFVQAAEVRLAAKVREQAALVGAIETAERELAELTALATARVRASRGGPAASNSEALPEPLAAWSLAADLQDARGAMHCELRGEAHLVGGALVVDGRSGFAVSAPLPKDVRQKTLCAWVQLGDLAQQGGGVMSLQDAAGEVFDAIVFGEQQPGRWLAGSNTFARTQSFDGPVEVEANDRPVHLAIAYAEDGTITAYRNGAVYGRPYHSSGPVPFAAGNARVLFGLRHGDASGNRLLRGGIQRAALFDRALTAAEVLQLARAGGDFVTMDELRVATTPAEQARRTELEDQLVRDRARLRELDRARGATSAWADLGHALCNQKEFRYLR